MRNSLPLLRSHEIMDLKRCPKKWYWKWRLGLVPKTKSFGALDLGTWVHDALAHWYTTSGKKRTMAGLLWCFDHFALTAIKQAHGSTPDHVIAQAHELHTLGRAMLAAYGKHYRGDRGWDVVGAEIPLEVEITDEQGESKGLYRMKLDLAVRERTTGEIWIVEHKTAKAIRTDHLTIDGQARPYGTLAEIAMKRLGIIERKEFISGILYNFIRKAMPDIRDVDAKGLALNKDGTVSKRQPSAMFLRHRVTLTRRAKVVALKRIRHDVMTLTDLREQVIYQKGFADTLSKTPHWSCPKFCDFFTMCELEEQGGNITQLRRGTFIKQNPYDYETTDEAMTFEMG